MKQSWEIIKDLFISILIVACITLIVSVIFYDKIALSRAIPQAEDYIPSNEMKKGIEDNKGKDAEEVKINYYIDATDLKKYEKNHKDLNGKSNPFENISILNTDDSGDDNTIKNNNSSGGFYEDDGSK